jgi:predicted transcriptional regulator
MHTIDIEMPDEQAARLDRFAMSVHKSPRKTTVQLIEKACGIQSFPL